MKRGWIAKNWSDEEVDDTKPASTQPLPTPTKEPAIVYNLKPPSSPPLPLRSCLKSSCSTSSSPPSSPSPSTSTSTSTSTSIKKTVKLIEPSSIASLRALREFWSAPAVHASNKSKAGHSGGGGIAGYRRTGEIYENLRASKKKKKIGITIVVQEVVEDAGKGKEKEKFNIVEVVDENHLDGRKEKQIEDISAIPQTSTSNDDDEDPTSSSSSSESESESESSSLPRRPLTISTSRTNRLSSPSPSSNINNRSSSPSLPRSSHPYIVRSLGARTCSPAGLARRKHHPSSSGGSSKLGGGGTSLTPKWIRSKQVERVRLDGLGSASSGSGRGSGDGDGGEDTGDESNSSMVSDTSDVESEERGRGSPILNQDEEEADDEGFEDVTNSEESSGTTTPTGLGNKLGPGLTMTSMNHSRLLNSLLQQNSPVTPSPPQRIVGSNVQGFGQKGNNIKPIQV